ncbi:hypothetical protein KR215_008113 [Drosophila sulfurigaster]|nr:hypothetical protein KR215_008113 [Drosophila sulfurigaster]
MLPLARGIYSNLVQITRNGRVAIHTASALRCKAETEESSVNEEEKEAEADTAPDGKDRTKVIPVETSIRYLKSDAYKTTYGEEHVWTQYRRNHKGMYAPRKTRKQCIRQGKISTGNPCPICRDEYLVLDYRNKELLQQFISPYSGQVLSYSKTGLCQKSHLRLTVAVEQARDCGLITYDVPFREYDYAEYYGKKEEQKK